MVLQRLRWVAAQLGRKPGRQDALARLLAAEHLPGTGWQLLDERTWRTGVGAMSDTARRAHEAGSITAWRSFQDSAAERWVWLQVVPMAGPHDAREALSELKDKFLTNLRAKVTVVSEQDVELDPFPGAQAVWAHEQHTTGPTGDGVARVLAGAVGSDILVVTASGSPEWEWAAVSELAARQAERLAP